MYSIRNFLAWSLVFTDELKQEVARSSSLDFPVDRESYSTERLLVTCFFLGGMRSLVAEAEVVVVIVDFWVGAGESSSDEEMGSSSISRRRWFIKRNRMLISLVRRFGVLGWLRVAGCSVRGQRVLLGRLGGYRQSKTRSRYAFYSTVGSTTCRLTMTFRGPSRGATWSGVKKRSDAGIAFDTNSTLHAGAFAFAALVVIVWRQRDTGLGRVTVSSCAEPSPDSEA